MFNTSQKAKARLITYVVSVLLSAAAAIAARMGYVEIGAPLTELASMLAVFSGGMAALNINRPADGLPVYRQDSTNDRAV